MKLLKDGVDVTGTQNDTGDAFTMPLTTALWHQLQVANFTHDIADFWFDTVYFDLTQSSNIKKFRNDDGKPVSLGTTGQLPTGSSPAIFFTGNKDEFVTNQGYGGAFTELGTIEDATTSPSD